MWLTALDLVLPDSILTGASLRVEQGRITEIVDRSVPEGLSCGGRLVFPGFIDMHGDMIEKELEPRVNVHFPMDVALHHLDARLAAAGVTTAYAAVSFSKGAKDGERRSFEHTSQTIRALHDARDTCRVDHRIHARFDITFDNAVGVLEGLLSDQQVDLVSLMDHTPGQGQYRNIERHIENLAAYHGVSPTEARQIVSTKIAERSRPQEVLLANLTRVAALCRTNGVALASHDDDTAAKAELLADLGAVIAEFPVTQDAARAGVARGLMTAMGAPNAMRGESYSGNLSAREAHAAGLLHILAADYHPGAILPAIRALSSQDPGGLPGATRLATLNPAKALGLKDRGAIQTGLLADLVIVDATDRIDATLRAGEVIYSNGTLGELAAFLHKAA